MNLRAPYVNYDTLTLKSLIFPSGLQNQKWRAMEKISTLFNEVKTEKVMVIVIFTNKSTPIFTALYNAHKA